MARTKRRTVPEVFIVESLHEKEEEAGRYDGKRLHDILCLHPRRLPRYYYIRTKRELKEMARLFRQSNYRYLHLSCHGDETGLELRLGTLSFADVADIFRDCLNERRLFVSACEVGVDAFAKAVFRRNSRCFSVVAPQHSPKFTESAIFWSAFYHLMRKRRRKGMKGSDISAVLDKLAKVFPPRMAYFRWNAAAQHLREST